MNKKQTAILSDNFITFAMTVRAGQKLANQRLFNRLFQKNSLTKRRQ